MAVVLGLGNPGLRYARTRHNAGWRVVEILVHRWAANAADDEREYRSWRAQAAGRGIDLVMPLTYMNRSGEAVAAWRDRYGLDTGSLLVVADDVYLPVGSVRVRSRGSSGGHRGLESVEGVLGTREYARLRIGVGSVDRDQLVGHVLAAPAEDEEKALADGIRLAADAVECWVAEGVSVTMNRFNRRIQGQSMVEQSDETADE